MLNGGYILILSLLNKSDLAIFNKRSFNYQLADAEKDYMLALASKGLLKYNLTLFVTILQAPPNGIL